MMKEPLKHLLQNDIAERGESSIIDICEIIEGGCSALASEAKTWIEKQCWKNLAIKFHKIMGTYRAYLRIPESERKKQRDAMKKFLYD